MLRRMSNDFSATWLVVLLFLLARAAFQFVLGEVSNFLPSPLLLSLEDVELFRFFKYKQKFRALLFVSAFSHGERTMNRLAYLLGEIQFPVLSMRVCR